ncbi:MAG: hypothetical protein V4510_09930 [bacterium]
MGYEVYRKGRKPKSGAARSFTFPALTANLDAEIVEQHKLGPALQRIGKALLAQYAKAGPRPDGQKQTIGVEFSGIDFVFLLDDPEPEPERRR